MIKIKTSIVFILSFICYFFTTISFCFADDELNGECLTLGDYVSEGTGENFLLMGAFRIIASACSSVANLTWSLFAPSLQELIIIGAAIYIAVYTLRIIGSFSQQDTAGYLSNERTGIIPLSVKAGVVILLLSSDGNTFLYGKLISPVVGASMNIGSTLGTSIGGGFGDANDVEALFGSVIEKVKEFNSSSYQIVAMGRNLICLTFLPDGIFNKIWSLLPFGTVLYIFGWLICIGVAFSMMDTLFRLAIGCILLPFAVACGFSKLTSTYTKKVWVLFVNVCYNFILLGVVINFSVEMLSNAISGNGNLKEVLEGTIFESKEQIENLANTIPSGGILLTFLCSLLTFRIFSEVEQNVDKLSGASPVGNTAKNTVTPFVRGATNASKKLVTEPMKATYTTTRDTIVDSKYVVSARTSINNFKRNAKNSVKNFFGIRD